MQCVVKYVMQCVAQSVLQCVAWCVMQCVAECVVQCVAQCVLQCVAALCVAVCDSYVAAAIHCKNPIHPCPQLTGSLKLQVSFTEYRLFYRALL